MSLERLRVRITDRWVGDGEPCFMVAEIGAYPEEKGVALVRAVAKAGAAAVKVQTFRAETLAQPGAYFTLEDGTRVSQYERCKKLELSFNAHKAFQAAARECGLVFFSTPSHPGDVEMLEKLGVPAYKTGSDDLTNLPFLEHIARKKKPMIVSTGMSQLEEVGQAVAALRAAGNDDFVLLHCVVGYPARLEQANLRAMRTLRRSFGTLVGFSDHLLGHAADIAAVALGACVIEKHVVLEKIPGDPDSDVACLPDDFAALARAVRETEKALGDGVKVVMPDEEKWRTAARKSIVALRDLEEGRTITAADVGVLRPGTGISPAHYREVLGRRTRCRIPRGMALLWEHI